MIAYRAAALSVAACLTSLSLAACSGGLTNASPTNTAPPATFTTSAPSTGASSTGSGGGTVSGGTTVSVGGTLGTFPVPSAAQVVSNGITGNHIEIALGGITPADLASFYATALPQAGYTVTSNTLATVLGVATGGIDFTGHGYKGSIGDMNGTIGIDLTPQG